MVAVPHLELDTTTHPGITVVYVKRRIYEDAVAVDELGRELFALLEGANHPRIVVVWSLVNFLSSSALNKLILFDTRCKAAGGRYVFCEVRPEISEILAITRFDRFVPIESCLANALDRLNQAAS